MDFTRTILYGVSNKKWLSELLKIEKSKLKNIRNNFNTVPFVKKVNGKNRELYNAGKMHKLVLKRIVKYLQSIDIPNYIHGGITGKSYVTNVESHKKNRYGVIIDISNFFPSTDAQNVYNFFRFDMNQSTDIAKIMTDLTTVSKGNKSFLLQGFPTSPILSFLAYHKMYELLNNYAKVRDLTFSAYYDDLTFSSRKRISKRCLREIVSIIESNSLEINLIKSKVSKLNYTKITGCVIVGNELKAPNKLQKETHDLFLKIKNGNLSETELSILLKRFLGKISAIQMIEKNRKFPNYLKLIEDKKRELMSRRND